MLEEQLTKLRKAIDGRLSPAFPLGRLPIIVLQHAAQSLLTPDRSSMPSVGLIRQDQPIAETLVVALAMVMHNEFVNRFAQCAFTEENQVHPQFWCNRHLACQRQSTSSQQFKFCPPVHLPL